MQLVFLKKLASNKGIMSKAYLQASIRACFFFFWLFELLELKYIYIEDVVELIKVHPITTHTV